MSNLNEGEPIMNNKFKSAFVERDFHGVTIIMPKEHKYVAMDECLSVVSFGEKPSKSSAYWSEISAHDNFAHLGQLTTKEAIPVSWDESLVCYKEEKQQ
jgi:hypothetical protein